MLPTRSSRPVHRRRRLLVLVVVAALLSACGGGSPPNLPDAASAVLDARTFAFEGTLVTSLEDLDIDVTLFVDGAIDLSTPQRTVRLRPSADGAVPAADDPAIELRSLGPRVLWRASSGTAQVGWFELTAPAEQLLAAVDLDLRAIDDPTRDLAALVAATEEGSEIPADDAGASELRGVQLSTDAIGDGAEPAVVEGYVDDDGVLRRYVITEPLGSDASYVRDVRLDDVGAAVSLGVPSPLPAGDPEVFVAVFAALLDADGRDLAEVLDEVADES